MSDTLDANIVIKLLRDRISELEYEVVLLRAKAVQDQQNSLVPLGNAADVLKPLVKEPKASEGQG